MRLSDNHSLTHIMLHVHIVLYLKVCCANIFSYMLQFAKENAKMDMASEMMGDAVDDALDDDEVEGETDDLMNQVRFNSFYYISACTTQSPAGLASLLDSKLLETVKSCGWHAGVG